jgi:hypothetical protein
MRHFLLGAAFVAVACSTTTKPADGPYPAFAFDAPQLKLNPSPVITEPKIVTVTWSADPQASALESFGDQLGTSDYWKSTVGEYGVGAATSGTANHVHITTAPLASMTPDDVDSWFVAQLTGKNGWPAVDPSTIYVIYIPTATQLLPADPYHAEAAIGTNAHVPYVVIAQTADSAEGVDKVTEAASHEIAEAATNPRVLSSGADLGLVDFDRSKYLAWSLTTGDAELGDLCEGTPDSAVKGPAAFPFLLQRLWSNKSAAAGHDPCVPAPAGPYYNVTPIDAEPLDVFVDTDTTPSHGPGFRIGLGQKRTIRVGFFSDAKMAAPWTITAAEGNYFSPASNHRLTIAVTHGTGNNGDYGSIEVTANAQSAGTGNAVLLTVTSAVSGLPSHTCPIVIGTY